MTDERLCEMSTVLFFFYLLFDDMLLAGKDARSQKFVKNIDQYFLEIEISIDVTKLQSKLNVFDSYTHKHCTTYAAS